MRALLVSLVAIGSLTASACKVGNTNGADAQPVDVDAPPPADANVASPRLDISMSPAALATELDTAASNVITVTLTSVNGFTGNVILSATGLPDSWSAQFDTSAFTMTADGTATAILTLTIPSTGMDGAMTIGVTGMTASDAIVAPTPTVVTAANQVTASVDIDTATGSCIIPVHGVAAPLIIRNGTSFRMRNGSASSNMIFQSVGGAGFPHEPDLAGDPETTPGTTYDVVPTDPTFAYAWYCHTPTPAGATGLNSASYLSVMAAGT